MTDREAMRALDAQYERERTERERERGARVEEVRQALPEIAALQDEIARLISEGTRKVLRDRASAHRITASLKEEVAALNRRIRERLIAGGYAADYLDLRCGCPECRDTGFADESCTVRCPCFLKRLHTERLGTQEATHRFEAFDGGIFPSAEQRARTEAARDLCAAFADRFPNGPRANLILIGESGLGKTFLLDCVCRRILERGHAPLRATAFRVFEAMRAYHFGDEPSGATFEQMIAAPFLAIDDLGTEPVFKNITIEYFFTLLNERAASGLPTAVATNLTPGQLQQRYGERVLSRLMDRAEAILLTGADLRLRAR